MDEDSDSEDNLPVDFYFLEEQLVNDFHFMKLNQSEDFSVNHNKNKEGTTRMVEEMTLDYVIFLLFSKGVLKLEDALPSLI